MNSEHRLTATRYIWVAFFFAMAISNMNVMVNGEALAIENIIMTTILAIAAAGSTIVIWATASRTSSDEETSDTKLKRGERVTRLIDLMDEDELHELRQRLSTDNYDTTDEYVVLGDDGELRKRHLKN